MAACSASARPTTQSLPGGQTYRQYLVDQGYLDSVAAKEMKNPVLVRIRSGQMEPGERTAFTREANERTTMTMSATEKAMADAAALSPETVGLYRGGEVAEAGNRDFVRSFMQSVVSPNEQGAMVTPDGELSQEAIRRVQAALLAKAFGDPDLVGALVESTDNNIKAIGGAMMDVAGSVVADARRSQGRHDQPGRRRHAVPARSDPAGAAGAQRGQAAVGAGVADRYLFRHDHRSRSGDAAAADVPQQRQLDATGRT